MDKYPYTEILILEGLNEIQKLHYDIKSIKIRDENDRNVVLKLTETGCHDFTVETNNLSKYANRFRQCKCQGKLFILSPKDCKIIINTPDKSL